MLILIELIVWAVLCTLLVSSEKGFEAFIVSVVAAVALWLAGINVFTWAWENPTLLVKGFIAYLIAGFCWATFKFAVKLRKARNKYVSDKADYLKKEGTTAEGFIEKVGRYDREKYAPTVNDNKGNILFWAWWWPFSVIGFLFEDILREIVNLSWRAIKGFFDGIRVRLLGEAARDLDN